MRILKSLLAVLLPAFVLAACAGTGSREPSSVAGVSASDINYTNSTSCTQVEADIEKWIAKAGTATSDDLARTIVTKAADRCVSLLNESGKTTQLSAKKQDCTSIPKRSIASVADDLIYSQCIISAGVATEKGL